MVKKQNHKRRKKHKRNHYAKYFLGVALILSLVLVILLVSEYVSFAFVGKIFEKPHLIELDDECSLIMGNLVHQIRDETDCNLRCNNECNMEDTKLKSSEFSLATNGCNTCSCYCK